MLGSRIPVWDKVSHLPCFCVSSVRMCVCVCVMGIHTYIKSHILYEVYFLQWRMCRSCSLSFLPQSSHILSPLSVLELSHPAVFAAICTFYGTFTCTFSPMCNKRCSFGKNAHWLFLYHVRWCSLHVSFHALSPFYSPYLQLSDELKQHLNQTMTANYAQPGKESITIAVDRLQQDVRTTMVKLLLWSFSPCHSLFLPYVVLNLAL